MGQRHDDVRDELAHLCTLALSDSRVKIEPEIFYRSDTRASQPRTGCKCTGLDTAGKTICKCLGDEARGDVAAYGFWKTARTTAFDVRDTDTDAPSYGNTASDKILESAAKQKRSKYEEACTKRRRDFTPMVYSVDGLPCKSARAAEKRIAALLAGKWDRQYSQMASFVRTRMALAVARSNTLLLHGDRSTSWRRKAPEDGSAAAAVESVRQ